MNGMSEDEPRLRIHLDTNVFIRAFEGIPSEVRHIRALFEELQMHPGTGVTSELTLAELLAPVERPGAKPLHLKRRFYLNLIAWSRFIDLRPTTRSIWLETADLRRHAHFKLPDAVHVVTAVQTHCRFFISNDRRVNNLPQGLSPIRPDESGIAVILEALRA
jgi:predicted nucleic acid-binding protein